MKSFIIASAALAATVAADTVGSAIVINKCGYSVNLCNVPSADGGFSEIDEVLEPEGTYTQQWTELTNGNGWSIKLAKNTDYSQNVLQYEYTFHDDGTIWYDLSEVNGNPWDGDWEITSNSPTCSPKQQAYRYATDDAYGMQACPQNATITVTICSGDDSNDGAAASASSSVASLSAYASAKSTTLAASTTEAPPATSAEASSTAAAASSSAEVSVATTLVTATITSAPASGTTDVVTTTQAATTTYTRWHHWSPPSKRHHARHIHN
ncbi:hypothetical protein H2203_005871 [Taxawa tesnikishii (nom. ined.)]|nr:hypothetical protein H2203_005871 [Dothideales sp. JES 119]